MKLNRLIRFGIGLIVFLNLSFAVFAQHVGDHNHDSSLVSPYAGEESRKIRTLSEEDIRQLENGEGWGLAKAAELNGLPGPAHILEMVDQGEMHLSADQLAQIRSLSQEMKARAVPLGLQLIEQEGELNGRFAAGDITESELRTLLTQISDTSAELRYVHLSTHLETLPLLTLHQIEVYNRVRGYTSPGSESLNGDDQFR